MVIVLGNPILPVVGLPLHTYAQLPTSLLQGPPGFGHMLHGMGSRRLPYGALIFAELTFAVIADRATSTKIIQRKFYCTYGGVRSRK